MHLLQERRPLLLLSNIDGCHVGRARDWGHAVAMTPNMAFQLSESCLLFHHLTLVAMHAGVFKRKQPAAQCNRGPPTSSADAQPSTARHSSVQEPAGLFSRGPAAAPSLRTSSSATTTGGEGKQAQTLPGASGRSSSSAQALPSTPGQPEEPLPGEIGQSSSAALATASSSEQTSQQVSQPPADSATSALETASGDASAPSQPSHSAQTLAPSAAAQDQIPKVDVPEAAVSRSGLAHDAEQHEASGSSSDADDAESRLQTPRAAGRDDNRPDDGLEASGGSEDWTNVPPPGISDGTLGGAEGSLPLQGDGPTASGSCQEAGPRSRATAVQLRQQLAHGIPQVDICWPSLHFSVSLTCVQPYCSAYIGFRCWGKQQRLCSQEPHNLTCWVCC